jgi:hypothetical protein
MRLRRHFLYGCRGTCRSDRSTCVEPCPHQNVHAETGSAPGAGRRTKTRRPSDKVPRPLNGQHPLYEPTCSSVSFCSASIVSFFVGSFFPFFLRRFQQQFHPISVSELPLANVRACRRWNCIAGLTRNCARACRPPRHIGCCRQSVNVRHLFCHASGYSSSSLVVDYTRVRGGTTAGHSAHRR